MTSGEDRITARILSHLSGAFDVGFNGKRTKRAPNRHELGRIEQLAYAKDQGLKALPAKSFQKRAQSAPGGRRPGVERSPSPPPARTLASGESVSALNRPLTAHSTSSLHPLSSAASRDTSRRRTGAWKGGNGFGIAPRKFLRQVMYSNSDTHRESFPLAPGQYDISLGSIHWRRDLESNQSQQYLSKHKTVPVYSFGKPQSFKTPKSKGKDKDASMLIFEFPGPCHYTLPDPWARYEVQGMSFTANSTTSDEGESRFGNFVKRAKDMEIL